MAEVETAKIESGQKGYILLPPFFIVGILIE